eukprot:201007_1
MKLVSKRTLDHVVCNSRFASLSCARPRSNVHITRHRFSSQDQKPNDKNKDKDPDKKDEENKESGSIFSLFKDIVSWSMRAADSMKQDALKQHSERNKDDTSEPTTDDMSQWISMWTDIKEANQFEIDIDPNQYTEYTSYYQLSQTEFMHRTMMKVNYYPLKYEEFMVGAFQGIQFVFECLEQNDLDGLKAVLTPECMDKMNDLKHEILDEKYHCVGKIMAILKEVNNSPNFKDSSINARYHIRYYYQLKCAKDGTEDNADGNEEYIQKRIDLVWQSLWVPVKGWTFKISDDGWKIEDVVECVKVDKKVNKTNP